MSPGTSLAFLSAPPNPPFEPPSAIPATFCVPGPSDSSRPPDPGLSPFPRTYLEDPARAAPCSVLRPRSASLSTFLPLRPARSLPSFRPYPSSASPSSPSPLRASLGPRGPQAPWPCMRPSPARSPPLRSPFFSRSRAPRPAPAP